MLFRTFPPEERVRASSILTVPTAVAPALGPVLGGLLVTDLSWRWVFFVNLPIGIIAFTFGLIFLEEHRQPHPGRFDHPGFVLSGVGFAAVMFGVSEGADRGWGSPEIVASLVVGAPCWRCSWRWSCGPAHHCSSCASTAIACSARRAWSS